MEKKDTLSSCSESEEQQMQLIQDKSKESCMVSFQRLHSHLKRLSNNDLKGSRTENGFERTFATLLGQDFKTFTSTMFLNMDQIQKQLDNNEFQEIGSMASFKVLETQFQMFIKSKIYLNDEYIVMTRNYFLQYTQLDIPEFHETLVQFMEYVKKLIDERALHKREHDSRVNERQTQTTMERVDTSKELDASSVIIKSNGTESQKQDTSSRSGNDADIRPIYDEEPMAEVQMTADDNVSATGQQHTEQPESNNEGEVDQNADQCYDIRPLPAKLTDNRTIELSNQLLESKNVCLKKTVAQCQKDFAKLEAHCINLELQMENNVLKSGQQSQFLKEKSNEAKVKNDIDVTETINIELEHSVAKLLAENEQLHKEKEHLKQTYKDLFDSIKRTRVQTKDQNDSLMAQLNKKSNENADVLAQIQKKGFAIAALKNELRKLTGNSVNTKFAKPSILGKPVGQPLKNQSVVRQPTAFKSERPRISKPRFASQVDVNNDLSKPVTTHHLPKGRESAPAKPHHMIAPSSSRYSSNDIVHNHYLEEAKKKTHEHSRIPRNFSDSKHFVCSTCQKCVFNANHDACVIKFLKEVNSRAKVPSNKTTNRNKPVEQIRVATKPKRQIPKGHRFSIKKTTTVHEKTTSPRSCLRWQPTGRILKTVCLRWVPTGKTFASSTTKVESEPPNGSNADIPNQCESEQALNVSADISENRASRNFDLMITKRRLIAADQASVFMAMTFEQRSSSLAPFLNVQMTSVHISSGLVLHQMTSDHNRSELRIQDHSNEPSSSKLVPKVVPLAVKTATSRQELELLFHHHIAMLRTTVLTGSYTPLPKLIGATPAGTPESLISLSDLSLNMADLTFDSSVPKKTRPSVKVGKGSQKVNRDPFRLRNHLSGDCFLKPKCSTYGFTDNLTKENLEHDAVKKTLIKLKAQSPLMSTPKKAPMIPKPFKECKYCGFNDHHSDNYEYYLLKGEYDIWAMKMQHYLSHTDYPIWEVIQKGNGPVSVSINTNRVIKVLPPKTAEEILARERERKARTTLLMALPEDHLAKFHKMTDAKEMWDAIKSRFGGNDESKKMQKYILKQQFEGFSVSNSEGLHKGYDRFQSLLSQLKIHGAGVSTEDANQKFLRSLPSSWSQVSLVMRTKPGVDSLSFDDLYNNLRVFESDVKGSTGSSSSAQNVAFVSSESTSSTNDVSTAYGVSTSSSYNSQRENSSSYTDELMYSFFANQSSGPQLDHEDLEQLDEFDLEEMGLKWQVAMISMRLKKFYKKTDQKEIKKAEGEMQGTLDIKQKTMGGDLENRRNQKLCNSGSDTEVKSCSKECVESYAKLKKLYDEQREQLDDKTDVLTYHKKLLAEAVKEKEELKTKLENFQSSSKGLSKLLNSQMSAKDKFGLGYGDQEYESDSDDDYVIQPSKEQEKPSFAFVNTIKHVKTYRETVKEKNTCSPSPKVDKKTECLIPKSLGLDMVSLKGMHYDPQKALKNKRIIDGGCSRHMTRNKAYLVEYQDYNGGLVAFRGSNGQITGKDEVVVQFVVALVEESSQTVNDEKQIHATVDSKEVVITKALIRSSLLLNDADGTACLTNEAIFQNLALMGVLALETFKDAQAAKIIKLKTRINKLENKYLCELDVDIYAMVWTKWTQREAVNRHASRPEVSTATLMTPPTTTSVFKDEDIFLADALVMLSDKEKLKGVEIKEKNDFERHYTVDERAKLVAEYFENRKKQLAEERAAAIRNKPPTRSQLRSLMMTYLKHTSRYKHVPNKKTLEEIQVLYIKEQERIADFVPIGSERDERMIEKMNKKAAGVHEEKVLEEPGSTKVENCWDHTLILEDGTKIHMLAERKYQLTKETLKRMLSLKLIAESASKSAYNLLKFIQKQIDEYGSYNRTLAIPEQTATGKEISNPFMADSLPKTTRPT
ncbi:hypothetical protein Tco_0731965 [Tanacetum coccineum]